MVKITPESSPPVVQERVVITANPAACVPTSRQSESAPKDPAISSRSKTGGATATARPSACEARLHGLRPFDRASTIC